MGHSPQNTRRPSGMTLPSTSSQLRLQSPQPRQLHQPRHRRPPNLRLRKPPLPQQQRPLRLTPVIHTTTQRPIDRVININPVNRRHTIPPRTQPRRPPKRKPRHSTTKLNRTARPGNSSTPIRRGTSTLPKRNPTRLRADHARGRHSQVQLLPRLRRRHRARCLRPMQASSVRLHRRLVNVQWQIRLRQRRRAGNRTSLRRVARGRHLRDRAPQGTSPRPYLHI